MPDLFSGRGSGPFYDEWEAQSDDTRRRVMRQRLDGYVAYAAQNAPFYRDRVSRYGRDPAHPLAEVPILSSRELRELLPPKSNALVVGGARGYNVFQSGGTTGFPKTTIFSHEELEELTLPNARGFFALGLEPGDRVANVFAVGGLYMTFLHINRMLQQYGCMNFPFSNHYPPDLIHTVIKLFDINCVAGVTSVVLGCLRGLRERGSDGIRIEKIFYGGEHIYEADKKEIRDTFGARVIAAPGYGTIDTWYLGYQCLACDTGVFHAHDDQCAIEIVSEDGLPCPEGEAGLVLATPFLRRLTPIVRYQVGDRAVWLGKCPCGRTTPIFRLLGRGDDVLRIGFDSIDYDFIQESAARVGRLHSAIQMEKKRAQGRDQLIIRVESPAPAQEYPALVKALEAEIVAKRVALREALANGSVAPLAIDILEPGTLPRSPRTGKLVRVIDAV